MKLDLMCILLHALRDGRDIGTLRDKGLSFNDIFDLLDEGVKLGYVEEINTDGLKVSHMVITDEGNELIEGPMRFEKWYEENKERLMVYTLQGSYKEVWKAAWAQAIQTHWMEAYELGKADLAQEIEDRGWEKLKDLLR